MRFARLKRRNISPIFLKCCCNLSHNPYFCIRQEQNGDYMSSKREKFVELAEARVNRAIKDLQLIGNLSNRSAYEFTEADVRKMFAAIQKASEAAKARFGRENESAGGEFRL